MDFPVMTNIYASPLPLRSSVLVSSVRLFAGRAFCCFSMLGACASQEHQSTCFTLRPARELGGPVRPSSVVNCSLLLEQLQKASVLEVPGWPGGSFQVMTSAATVSKCPRLDSPPHPCRPWLCFVGVPGQLWA